MAALAVVVVIVIVVAGGAAYFVLTSSPSNSTTTSTTTTHLTSSTVPTTSTTHTTTLATTSSIAHTTTTTVAPTTTTVAPTTTTVAPTTTTPSQATQTSATCTSTTTTATTTTLSTAAALSVIKQFSSMSLTYSSTNETSGQTFNGTFAFKVVSSTSSSYKVNVTEGVTGESISYLFGVESSGTVDWAYTSVAGFSQNNTNPTQAADAFIGAMVEFELEAGTNQVYSFALLSQYFQVTGTGTVSIPSATISYKTYTAISPNTTFGYCGNSFTYSQFDVQVGTIQGTSLQVLVSATIKGTENSTPVNYSIMLTGVTVA
jgi:hypothetical protein